MNLNNKLSNIRGKNENIHRKNTENSQSIDFICINSKFFPLKLTLDS